MEHLLDLQSGADSLAPGECDGSWCEVYSETEDTQLSTLAITSQVDATDRREIVSNLGGLGGFDAMTDGFVMWKDVDPSAPDGVQAAGPPAQYGGHEYMYDPSTNRNIELPVTPSGIAFTSGHFVIWEDRPADRAADRSMSFADLDQLR